MCVCVCVCVCVCLIMRGKISPVESDISEDLGNLNHWVHKRSHMNDYLTVLVNKPPISMTINTQNEMDIFWNPQPQSTLAPLWTEVWPLPSVSTWSKTWATEATKPKQPQSSGWRPGVRPSVLWENWKNRPLDRYFQQRILWAQFLHLLISRKTPKSVNDD